MSRPARDERGVTVIVVALAMAVILVMVAIVVDLGSTRAMRRDARAIADAAATAGAFDLGLAPATACATAFGYAFSNAGSEEPTIAEINDACTAATNGGMDACTAGGEARVATLPLGAGTVRVTHPVPDGHRLLVAKAVGIQVDQQADATTDGTACQRLGVEITQPQSRLFGGVASSQPGTFSVHSVARYQPALRGLLIPPAMVVLDQHACKSIDTGSGKILVEATELGPGLVYSDSDGTAPACTGGQGILHTSGSGALRAAASPSAPGELAWYSAPSRGYSAGQSVVEYGTTSTNKHYVGKLYARDTRVTREPADKAYRCTSIPVTPSQPLCPTAADPVEEADSLAQATTPPAGFTLWHGPCTTTGGTITMTGKLFVNCPTFEIKGNPLRVTGGATIIFKERLDVAANGTLAVNVSSGSVPAVDAEGLPTSATPTQSRLIVGSTAANAFDLNSNSAGVFMAETFVYSRGGFRLQSLDKLLWSPPSSGPTKSLLYWSESSEALAIQGAPALKAAGVMFQANGPLTGGGGGVIDLTDVQMWADKVILSGSTTVKLSPDPGNSIKLAGAGSALIR